MTIRKGTDNSSFLSPNLERGTSKLNKKKKKFPIKMMVFLKSPFPRYINPILQICKSVPHWSKGSMHGSHARGPGFEPRW